MLPSGSFGVFKSLPGVLGYTSSKTLGPICSFFPTNPLTTVSNDWFLLSYTFPRATLVIAEPTLLTPPAIRFPGTLAILFNLS